MIGSACKGRLASEYRIPIKAGWGIHSRRPFFSQPFYSQFFPAFSFKGPFVSRALIAHALEVWIFAVAYYAMHHSEAWGGLSGNFNGTLTDAAYFSFTTYTTLGFGDIEPTGHLRFLAGIESLTGLVLITWTASFLYLEMRKDWDTQ